VPSIERPNMVDEVLWLWPVWIPRARLSMILGPPGSEKSIIAAWIATTVLRGSGRFPDGAQLTGGPNWVTWVITESTHQLLVDRLTQMGAPLEYVRCPVDPEDTEDTEVCPVIDLTQERWLGLVAAAVAERRPTWVIVEAIGSRRGEIAPGIHRAVDVMAGVARDVGCAITFLFHREGDMPKSNRSVGVRSWAAIAARMATILSVSPWAPETNDLRLRVIKTDGERPEPLRVRIDTGVPRVVRRPVTPPSSAVDRAAEYLERHLANGPQMAFQLIRAARFGERISKRSLDRAKRRLEIRSYLEGRRWWWTR